MDFSKLGQAVISNYTKKCKGENIRDPLGIRQNTIQYSDMKTGHHSDSDNNEFTPKSYLKLTVLSHERNRRHV